MNKKVLDLLMKEKINCLSAMCMENKSKVYPRAVRHQTTIDHKIDGKNQMAVIDTFHSPYDDYVHGQECFCHALHEIIMNGEWETFEDFYREDGSDILACLEMKPTKKNIAGLKQLYKYQRGLYLTLEKCLGHDLLEKFLDIVKGNE